MARTIVTTPLAAALIIATSADGDQLAQGAVPNLDAITLLATIFVILVGAGLMPMIAALGRLFLKGWRATVKLVIVEAIAILRSELVKWLLLAVAVILGLV